MVKYLNQKGISLIEIMIVVAVAGLLITIAVPQYQKLKRTGTQAEAKFEREVLKPLSKTVGSQLL